MIVGIVGSAIAVELIREDPGTAACAPTKVKPMRCALPFLLAGILIASPAFAFSDLETQVRSAAGGAVAKMITGTKEEARAECEAARALLPATAPKYLSAYIESCLALTASEFGPHKKPESCPYYQRAIDIWRENPPPRENDEIALKRADMLKKWQDSLAENCPSAAAPTKAAAAKQGPIPVPEGATVETLEGISYVMPGGWVVEKFDETGGHATFKNDALKYALLVERKAADNPGDKAERETLSSGRVLEWEHIPFIPGGSFYVFYARVGFDDASVNIGMSSYDKASNDGVDKATALGIARTVAESMKVLGPRRCIAKCGPGTITPACSWCAIGLGIAAANAVGPKAGDTFRDCPDVCPEMVVVPAGSFTMGSNDNDSEKPPHEVTIAKPFAVGKFEVTFAEWGACVAGGGCKQNPGDEGWGRGSRPVISVSWVDVTNEYLPWLSKVSGKPYRLLSEAEWEYAARARTTTKFAFGDTISKSQAQFSEGKFGSAGKTVEVGTFLPNSWGLYDMHGNVLEWVEDDWHENYQGPPNDGSVQPDAATSQHILRGGSWRNIADNLRSANRSAAKPQYRSTGIGFRVARTL